MLSNSIQQKNANSKQHLGKKWIGRYKICSQNGVNYVLQSNTGKRIIAHYNQLRACPIPLGPGLPIHPSEETPGIVFVEPEVAGGHEVQGVFFIYTHNNFHRQQQRRYHGE